MGEHQLSLDVLVIGEALIDIVQSPTDVQQHVGGSPANVALGLGRRGLRVQLLTHVGDDDLGARIRRHLQGSHVDVAPASIRAPRTSTATATLQEDGSANYLFDVSWPEFPPTDAAAPKILHTGSIAAFRDPGADSVLEAVRSSGAEEKTFDPNIRPALIGSHAEALAQFEELAALCTVVKLSDEDAAWLKPGLSVPAVLDWILSLGPRLAAVTEGSAGATLATPRDKVKVDSVKVTVVDTIGAGDTFMTSLICSIHTMGTRELSADDLRTMGRHAVRLAALTVSRSGADLPWAHETP